MTVVSWPGSSALRRAKALHPAAWSPDPDHPAADPVDVAASPLAALCDEQTCRAYLAGGGEGRLSSAAGRGLIDLVVPYGLSDADLVLILIPALDLPLQHILGRRMTLAVTGSSDAFARWLVRVSGTVGTQQIGGADVALLAMPIDKIGGYRVTTHS